MGDVKSIETPRRADNRQVGRKTRSVGSAGLGLGEVVSGPAKENPVTDVPGRTAAIETHSPLRLEKFPRFCAPSELSALQALKDGARRGQRARQDEPGARKRCSVE